MASGSLGDALLRTLALPNRLQRNTPKVFLGPLTHFLGRGGWLSCTWLLPWSAYWSYTCQGGDISPFLSGQNMIPKPSHPRKFLQAETPEELGAVPITFISSKPQLQNRRLCGLLVEAGAMPEGAIPPRKGTRCPLPPHR